MLGITTLVESLVHDISTSNSFISSVIILPNLHVVMRSETVDTTVAIKTPEELKEIRNNLIFFTVFQ